MSNVKIYSILIFVMLLWGMNVSWLKMIISNGEPLTLQATRIFLAAITVFLLLICLRQKIYVPNMPWKYILIACFFGTICHHAFLAYGIDKTMATKTAIISGLSPLFTALIAVIFKDTIMTWTKFIGFTLGGIGVLIAVVKDIASILELQQGDFYVFMSFFLQAFSFIAIRRGTHTISPLLMTGWMLLIGSSILMIYCIVVQQSSFVAVSNLSSGIWGVLLLSAILATGIGHTLYNLCIKHIGAAESAIFANFNTVFALFGAMLFLNEAITLQQLIGCLCIFIGVFIGTGNVENWLRTRRAS